MSNQNKVSRESVQRADNLFKKYIKIAVLTVGTLTLIIY